MSPQGWSMKSRLSLVWLWLPSFPTGSISEAEFCLWFLLTCGFGHFIPGLNLMNVVNRLHVAPAWCHGFRSWCDDTMKSLHRVVYFENRPYPLCHSCFKSELCRLPVHTYRWVKWYSYRISFFLAIMWIGWSQTHCNIFEQYFWTSAQQRYYQVDFYMWVHVDDCKSVVFKSLCQISGGASGRWAVCCV